MYFDGLEDRFGDDTAGRLMGSFAEDYAARANHSRQQLDEYAIEPARRAKAVIAANKFDRSMANTTPS